MPYSAARTYIAHIWEYPPPRGGNAPQRISAEKIDTEWQPQGKQWVLFPRDKQSLGTKVERKQNSSFPAGPVIKCFVIPSNTNLEKLRRNCLLYAGRLIIFPRFQGARPDHMRAETSCCCFRGELVSFVRSRHVTRFPSIATRIWGGKYNKNH